jgi:cytochrome c oxidase cbb3-type subunit III
MKVRSFFFSRSVVCLSIAAGTVLVGYSIQGAGHVAAQQQSAEHGGEAPAPPAARNGRPPDFPVRPQAPKEVLDRGKAAYSVSCAFCHGSDAGGSVGPNLLRSEVVLLDKDGELIGPIVHGSRSDRGMPKIDVSDATVSDITAWLHSLKVGGKIAATEKINIVVGTAQAGKAAFDKQCGSCHSVTGDLKGFAAKFPDPRAMQQAWIMPGAVGRGPGAAGPPVEFKVPPTTATVTLADGKTVSGKLEAVDDFYVAVTTDDGKTHRFSRMNDSPKVDIHDPLAPHRELLRKYDDKDIHDITAYLESLK